MRSTNEGALWFCLDAIAVDILLGSCRMRVALGLLRIVLPSDANAALSMSQVSSQ